jgi:hypothetical protein
MHSVIASHSALPQNKSAGERRSRAYTMPRRIARPDVGRGRSSMRRPFSQQQRRRLRLHSLHQHRALGDPTLGWASPHIHDILHAHMYKLCSSVARRTVAHMQSSFPRLPTELEGRFDHLSEKTIRSWFDKKHTSTLLPSFARMIAEGKLTALRSSGSARVLDAHPDVEEEIKSILTRMRSEAEAVISINIIRWVMRTVIEAKQPDLLRKLRLSQVFLPGWVHSAMHWSWRKVTTAASKVTLDWRSQGILMAKRNAVNMETDQVSEQSECAISMLSSVRLSLQYALIRLLSHSHTVFVYASSTSDK